jgi:hypothetical protein
LSTENSSIVLEVRRVVALVGDNSGWGGASRGLLISVSGPVVPQIFSVSQNLLSAMLMKGVLSYMYVIFQQKV